MLGENALKEHERKRRVWLCDKDGLVYWSRIMDMCYVLSVNVCNVNKDMAYGKPRYWTDETILPKNITGCRCMYGDESELQQRLYLDEKIGHI